MTEMAPFNAKQSGQLGSDCVVSRDAQSPGPPVSSPASTGGLFFCIKLITYLNIVLRLRVSVVCSPVFGMTPHSETWTLSYLNMYVLTPFSYHLPLD